MSLKFTAGDLTIHRLIEEETTFLPVHDLFAGLTPALKIEKATLAGFDWGARTANVLAALWPERCKAMVSVSGYLIGSQKRRRKIDTQAATEGAFGSQSLSRRRRNAMNDLTLVELLWLEKRIENWIRLRFRKRPFDRGFFSRDRGAR